MIIANVLTSMGQVIFQYYRIKQITRVKNEFFKSMPLQIPRKIFPQKNVN